MPMREFWQSDGQPQDPASRLRQSQWQLLCHCLMHGWEFLVVGNAGVLRNNSSTTFLSFELGSAASLFFTQAL